MIYFFILICFIIFYFYLYQIYLEKIVLKKIHSYLLTKNLNFNQLDNYLYFYQNKYYLQAENKQDELVKNAEQINAIFTDICNNVLTIEEKKLFNKMMIDSYSKNRYLLREKIIQELKNTINNFNKS